MFLFYYAITFKFASKISKTYTVQNLRWWAISNTRPRSPNPSHRPHHHLRVISFVITYHITSNVILYLIVYKTLRWHMWSKYCLHYAANCTGDGKEEAHVNLHFRLEKYPTSFHPIYYSVHAQRLHCMLVFWRRVALCYISGMTNCWYTRIAYKGGDIIVLCIFDGFASLMCFMFVLVEMLCNLCMLDTVKHDRWQILWNGPHNII